MGGGTTRPKILTLLVTLIRLVGENSGWRGWSKGFFLIKVVPYQRRTHGCWSLRFLKNCTGRLLGLIMRANPPFASLCVSITDPLYAGGRSDASFFLLTVSWMRLDSGDWVTEVRYESWHVGGIYFWQVRKTRNILNDFRAILNKKEVKYLSDRRI